MRQDLYGRLCVFFLILINQFQVALERPVEFLAARFRQRDPGGRRGAPRSTFWYQLIDVFLPLALIVDHRRGDRVLHRLELRPAMAAVDDRLLHLALAPQLDALQAGARRRQRRQPGPAHLPGRRRLHQRPGAGANSGNAGIYNYTIQAISIGDQPRRLRHHPLGHLAADEASVLRLRDSGLPVLGRDRLRGGRDRAHPSHRPRAVGALSSASRRSRRISVSISRASANTASRSPCSKARTARSRAPASVFEDVFHDGPAHHQRAHLAHRLHPVLPQISGIIPYIVVAPFYFAKKVDFGRFAQSADAFGNVNSAMNFFVDRYTGLAGFRAAVQRLTSFETAFAARPGPGVDRAAHRSAGGRRPDPVAARRSISRSPTGASSPISPISRSCRRNRRWSSALWASASRPLPRDLGTLAVRLGRDPPARLRPAHAAAAAPLYTDRRAARRARLSRRGLGLHRRRTARRARRRSACPRSRTGLTITTIGRCGFPAASGGASRSPARCWRSPTGSPRRGDRLARRNKRGRHLPRRRADAADDDARLHRPPLDAQRLPPAPRCLTPTATPRRRWSRRSEGDEPHDAYI